MRIRIPIASQINIFPNILFHFGPMVQYYQYYPNIIRSYTPIICIIYSYVCIYIIYIYIYYLYIYIYIIYIYICIYYIIYIYCVYNM
jgi:hypothetical protein